MKIANIHVGTIHQNMRIALQFSYQFAIFISVCFVSVCNSHISVYSSYVDICNFHMSLQFLYQFAILTSWLQHLLTWLCIDSIYYDLDLIDSTSAMVLCGRQR
jgi:hypothetical protein